MWGREEVLGLHSDDISWESKQRKEGDWENPMIDLEIIFVEQHQDQGKL